MNEQMLKEAITSGLQNISSDVLPDLVKSQVEESVSQLNEDVKTIKNEMLEFVKELKTENMDPKKELFEKTAKFFKNVVVGNKAAMTEWVDVDGGYLVPEEFEKSLFYALWKYSLARKYCQKFSMGTDTKYITAVNNIAEAYIVGENTAITNSKLSYWRVKLEARKFASIVPSTNELIDDNMSNEEIFDIVLKFVVAKFGKLEDAQVLTGTGTGLNFNGVLNVWNVSTLKAGKTKFEDVTAEDVIDLVFWLSDKYSKNHNPIFIMNKTILGVLRKLKDPDGQRILIDNVNGGYSLLWYPVETTDILPGITETTQKDKAFMIFGDLSFYALWIRKGVSSEIGYQSDDFENDRKSLKVVERIAGAPLTGEAFQVLKTAAA